MSKKIFRSILATAMLVLLASLAITTSFLYDNFNKTQVSRLKEELSLAAAGVEQAGDAYFAHFRSSIFRFTRISAEGAVLYDSAADSAEMENHLDREEIREALQAGAGSSARYSSTLTERTFYEATRLSDGTVLRISATQVTMGALILGMLPAICAIFLLSLMLSLVLSQRMAKSVVRPLEMLDLDHPDCNETYEELTPILSRLNRQHKQITAQLQELQQRTDEFKLITASMQEGLVLLDKRGTVLSMNAAARTLFHADDRAVGHNLLVLDRSEPMSRALDSAMAGKHNEFRAERNGGEYQFIVSPTESGGAIVGIVLLCIDMTEAAFAERNRREFTANVSHELKTPLQSILGSAELLEQGLVRPEDTARFVGNIRSEAARLVTLIGDIIRLSQLDEGAPLPTEPVDLSAVAEEALNALKTAAEKRQVSLSFVPAPEACTLAGVQRYIYEIAYNLCDNAIRYNRDGGSVTVSVKTEDGHPVLTVRDTGIGISPEHQSRIFERFYRIDKSHSRETGGTGLGLSIVKHAAACSGAAIKLDSTVGVGTTVIVVF